MSDDRLTYEDLLSLYRGKATAVEQLAERTIAAVAIETPLTTFLRKVDGETQPRHVVLTGNAGDGKTFAALTSRTKTFTITPDASAGEEGRADSPIDALAEKLSAQLARGDRLLLAINRGQFERLEARTRRSADARLKAFVDEARAQAVLRESWPEKSAEVALIDLGLLDTSSRRVFDPLIEKIAGAVAGEALSRSARAAFAAAQASLQTESVQAYLRGVLRIARTHGHHATMRQLWSFVAFLATGALRGDAAAPATLLDAVGARLFSESAEGPLFEYAKELTDPSTQPQPRLARLALLGTLGDAVLSAIPEFGAGVTLPPDRQVLGEVLIRVAAVHGVVGAEKPLPVAQDMFDRAVQHLLVRPTGWVSAANITTPLLKGIYRALGLWCGGNSFPAWQTLCFDSSRLPRATSVASAEIDPQSLRLALPRPSPWAQEALAGAWTPPYLWLAAGGQEPGRETARLRLSARLFDLLYSEVESGGSATRSDLLTLQRWLAEFPPEQRRPSALRLGRREQRGPLQFSDDPLADRTVLGWEGRG